MGPCRSLLVNKGLRVRERALERLVTIMADQVPTTLCERQTIRLSIQADLLARRLRVLEDISETEARTEVTALPRYQSYPLYLSRLAGRAGGSRGEVDQDTGEENQWWSG